MRSLSLLVFFGLFLFAAASSRFFPEHVSTLPVPEDWQVVNDLVPTDLKKEIIIALRQRNRSQLETIFWEVSTPSHPNYGKFLSMDELTDLIAPSRRTSAKVVNWLLSEGVTSFTFNKNQDLLTVQVPVNKVEELFQVSFSVFEHVSGVKYVGSLTPYSIPKYLSDAIDLVAGVNGLPLLKTNSKIARPTPLVNAMANPTEIIPDVIRARYNVTSGLINSNANNSHAVAEFQGQYYKPSDLVLFFSKYVTVGSSFNNVSLVVGVNEQSRPGIEASLDIEYIMGVAPNATTWFVSIPAFPFWADLFKWVNLLGSYDEIPYVHTVSYGSQGNYPPETYRFRLDAEFQKLGVRGSSIIFASGDSGAGCQTEGTASTCRLAPSYPATNAYVTSVGATGFITGNTGPEEAVNYPGEFKSGGGFSWVIPQPSYQASVVNAYLSSNTSLPPSSAYNASGRATPDVAALGSIHFEVVDGGSTTPVGGTSASAPSFGAIITLLNQVRLNAGKPALGFLNPWLYTTAAANPTAFFDVVQGNNVWPCCTGKGVTTTSGFQTSAGWDPVTGLGTPNFEVLQNLV